MIRRGEVSPRPRWYYLLLNIATGVAAIGAIGVATIVVSLVWFGLTHPGPGAQYKLSSLVLSLPWYMPLVALSAIAASWLLVRRYDFSYKYSFRLLLAALLCGVLVGSYFLDVSGIDDYLARRGYFGRGLQQSGQVTSPRGRWGRSR